MGCHGRLPGSPPAGSWDWGRSWGLNPGARMCDTGIRGHRNLIQMKNLSRTILCEARAGVRLLQAGEGGRALRCYCPHPRVLVRVPELGEPLHRSQQGGGSRSQGGLQGDEAGGRGRGTAQEAGGPCAQQRLWRENRGSLSCSGCRTQAHRLPSRRPGQLGLSSRSPERWWGPGGAVLWGSTACWD